MKKQAKPWKVRVTWEKRFRTKGEMHDRLRDVLVPLDCTCVIADQAARQGRAQESDDDSLLTVEVVNAPIR